MFLVCLVIAAFLMTCWVFLSAALKHWPRFWRGALLVFGAGFVPGAFVKGKALPAAIWGLYAWYGAFLFVAIALLCGGAWALWTGTRNFFAGVSGPRNNIYIHHYHEGDQS